MKGVAIASEVSGVITELSGVQGSVVGEGDVVAIVESIKMEIPLCASASGTLVVLDFRVGESVEEGQILGWIET